MAFNGSGVHNRVHDWTQDLAGTIPVTASRMDAEHDDISAALSNTICRDGQSTTTARIPFASGASAAAGTTSSVAYAQTNDPNTGLYFPATDQWGLVAGGTASLTSTATKLTAAVAVDFTGTAAPTSDDGAALGSTSQKWSDLFLAPGGVINFNSGDVTVTHSANALAFAGGAVSFDSQLTVSSGGITISAGGIAVTGNSSVTGTFSVTGNASVGGTLSAAGAVTFLATLQANGAVTSLGDFTVGSNKLTAAAVSGNTAIAGTLAVTGAVTANNAAGATARNTAKAFVYFTTDGAANVTIVGSFNVSTVAIQTVETLNGWRLTFSSALPSANFTAIGVVRETNTQDNLSFLSSTKAATTFDFLVVQAGVGAIRNNLRCDILFFDAS